MKHLLIIFLLILASCDIPEEPRRKKRIQVYTPPAQTVEELPWKPPMLRPDFRESDYSGLPAFMQPRPSPYSKKMWRIISRSIDEVIAQRRHLHASPELAHREVKTARYVMEQLKALGLEPRGPVGLTGTAMLLRGGQPGPTVGALAGLDGIPANETTGLHYASKAWGYWEAQKVRVSHGFGKDVEMAVLLGTARVLTQMRSKLAGNVLFVFQPASTKIQSNEKPGAHQVLSSGILRQNDVKALFYLPLDPGVRTGRIGVPTGAVNGGLTRFTIVVEGTKNRICSGSVPWKCVDPIAVASHLVQELLLLPSRKFGPDRQVILNVGAIHGGEAAHLMASKVLVSGTFRWIVTYDRKKMERLIKNLVSGTQKISGTRVRASFTKGPQLRVGNSELTSWSLPTLVRSLGKRGVLPADPLANPGDFTLYHKELPTAMFLLGCSRRNRYAGRRGSGSFNPDEETISVGMHVLSNLLMDYLTSDAAPGAKTNATGTKALHSREE